MIKKYNRLALIFSIIGAIVLISSSICGGTMFGYVHTTDPLVYRVQHLYPLIYCFGALIIYCAWRANSKKYAVIGLLEMLFIPLILGLILNDASTMWLEV